MNINNIYNTLVVNNIQIKCNIYYVCNIISSSLAEINIHK